MDQAYRLEFGEIGGIIGAERTRSGSVIPYQAKYAVGSSVKIAPVERLRAFMRPEWKYHHPVLNEQLVSAGKSDKVRSVDFYHGGDVLFRLVNESGTWQEECLDPE